MRFAPRQQTLWRALCPRESLNCPIVSTVPPVGVNSHVAMPDQVPLLIVMSIHEVLPADEDPAKLVPARTEARRCEAGRCP